MNKSRSCNDIFIFLHFIKQLTCSNIRNCINLILSRSKIQFSRRCTRMFVCISKMLSICVCRYVCMHFKIIPVWKLNRHTHMRIALLWTYLHFTLRCICVLWAQSFTSLVFTFSMCAHNWVKLTGFGDQST